MDTRSREIVAQVAYKSAVDVAIANNKSIGADTTVDQIHVIAQDLFDGIIALAGHADTVAAAQQAFAPTVNVTGTPEAFPAVPAPVQAPLPSNVTPLPVPGVPSSAGGGLSADSPVEDLWKDLFYENTGQWEDKRASKTNPKAPDFTHKFLKKNGSKFAVGLWVNDKTTPGWVKQALGA